MTHMKRAFAATAVLLSIMLPLSAHAELRSALKGYVVTANDNGTETYTPATTVRPGQLIEYRIDHHNTFNNAIGGVAIVGPVPDEAVVDVNHLGSSKAANVEVQGDFDPDRPGEEWSTLPAMRVVIKDDGSRELVEATPEDFTAVRWTLEAPMQSNEVVTNSWRVRVK